MIKKVVAIGGEPATGKTTLFLRLITELGLPLETEKYAKTFKYHSNGLFHIAGDYSSSETFAGTDRLSMSVQPEAEEFVTSQNGVLIFEGDRLFNRSFLSHCNEKTSLNVLILRAPKAVIDFRHKDRNDNQDDKFIRSRQTKINNICTDFELMGCIEEFENSNQNQQDIIVQRVMELIHE